MIYKSFKLEDYELNLEVGVVTTDDTPNFLSAISVSKGWLSKQDYESFLLRSLVKDSKKVMALLDSLESERDKSVFRYQILGLIYQLNSRLKPSHLSIAGDKVMHQSDALRNGHKAIKMQLNPGWISGLSAETLVDPNPVQDVISKTWEEVKARFPQRNYILKKVNVLDLEVPILDIKSVKVAPHEVVQEYIVHRCDGDTSIARASINMWKGHVLAKLIPNLEEIVHALNQGGYLSVYTDNLVMSQLYSAVIEVNPNLDWSLIKWSEYEGGIKDEVPKKRDGTKILKGKKVPFIRGIKSKPRSSREEIESEQRHFSDVSAEIILSLKDKIKERIIGQPEPIDSLVNAIAVARVGLRGDKRPIGCFLLPGPTGVGKTETAKVLADELGVELIRVDCSEYQQAHEVSKLFGAPPGYVGFEDNQRPGQEFAPPMTLAAKVKANPFAVVLFDELEKADPAIFNVLLQIMDDGQITSGRGETIKFNESIILMTSNIGTKEAEAECRRNPIGIVTQERDLCKVETEVIDKAIKARFNPEFRNRLTEILKYQKLSKETCHPIIDVLLGKTKENLEKAQHMTLSWSDAVKDYILEEGFSEDYGARNLERTIQKTIELPLAEWILKTRYLSTATEATVDQVAVNVKDNKIIFGEDNNGKEKVDSNSKRVSGTKSTSGKRKGTNSDKTQSNKDTIG
jgi:hypothetical protein